MSKLIIITAPSGAGKTTIVRHLLKKYDELDFSISATTRRARKKEKNGRDYYFYSLNKFQRLIKEGAFLEWQEVYEKKFYGTLNSEVDRIWSNGKHIIFDIEVKGAANIKKNHPEALAVFIKPPSIDALLERLTKRKTEDEDSLKRRIKRAKMELKHENNFDVVLVNDILDEALVNAEKIIEDFIF